MATRAWTALVAPVAAPYALRVVPHAFRGSRGRGTLTLRTREARGDVASRGGGTYPTSQPLTLPALLPLVTFIEQLLLLLLLLQAVTMYLRTPLSASVPVPIALLPPQGPRSLITPRLSVIWTRQSPVCLSILQPSTSTLPKRPPHLSDTKTLSWQLLSVGALLWRII